MILNGIDYPYAVDVAKGEDLHEVFRGERRGHWTYNRVEYKCRRVSSGKKVIFVDQKGADLFATIYGKDRICIRGKVFGSIQAMSAIYDWISENIGAKGASWHLPHDWRSVLVPGRDCELPLAFVRPEDAVRFKLVWG